MTASLCNWTGPWAASPLKERDYQGDDSIESLLHSLATGDQKSRQELDEIAERIFVLHRALTIRDMGTKDMRTKHDTIPDWVFADPKDKGAFSKGTIRMDKEDISRAMDMYYDEMAWDRETGSPTRATYQRLDLGTVADELTKRGLLA
jgi:aldehyde:ferredoxin oxidoreductase